MSITARAGVYLRACQRIYFNPQRIGTNAQLLRKLFETNVPTGCDNLWKQVMANALNHRQMLPSKVYNMKGCQSQADEASHLYLSVFRRFAEWSEAPLIELSLAGTLLAQHR